MKVRWSEAALSDLDAIVGEFDHPAAAARMVLRLRQKLRHVARFPYSGRIVERVGDETVREVIVWHFRAVYRIEPDRVHVLTVIDARRMPPPDRIAESVRPWPLELR